MELPARIVDVISTYHDEYRHPKLPRPEISRLYALFPDEEYAKDALIGWPADWPFGGRPGVYLIFDATMDLRYIGKASVLGRRLSQYFYYESGRGSRCVVRNPSGWKKLPAFIAAVAVTKTFEAPSLEEYLITTLGPPENIVLAGPAPPNSGLQRTGPP